MRLVRAVAGASLVGIAMVAGASAGMTTGSQAPSCFGLSPTIVGTEGDDQLLGTEGPDVIVGLGGADNLVGLGGDDALCGGPGNDAALPGPGNDRVSGGGGGFGLGFLDYVAFSFSPSPVQVDLAAGTAVGEGSDQLVDVMIVIATPYADAVRGSDGIEFFYPGAGNDLIDGRGGRDFVGFDHAVTASLTSGTASGEGADELIAIEGLIGSDLPDVLTGGAGPDYLTGGKGEDVLDGGGGDDRVFGDEGNDVLRGGGGEDSVFGNDGNDSVSGGSGNDKLGGDAGGDKVDGDAGADIVSYRESVGGVNVNLLVGRATGEGLDELGGIEYANGSQFRDSILGNAGTNFLWGNAGSDRIDGGASSDFLDGGVKTSRLQPGSGRDYCINGRGAGSCEIVGVPEIPVIGDRAPASLVAMIPPGGPRSGVKMAAPRAMRATLQTLSARIARTSALFGAVDPESKSDLDKWGILQAPLPMLQAGPSAPGAFRYVGQPSCFTSKRPYRTTVAPPELLEPILRDGAPESASWRGVLFRQRARGKLQRVRETPWLAGVLQGEGYRTGYPTWLIRRGAEYDFAPRSFQFAVQEGTYVWAGVIEWSRTKKRVQHHIAPHVVYTPKVQPDKNCHFG